MILHKISQKVKYHYLAAAPADLRPALQWLPWVVLLVEPLQRLPPAVRDESKE